MMQNSYLLIILPILLLFISSEDVYATHVSQPILTMKEAIYYIGSIIEIEGFVEYQDNPTSNVLLDIYIVKDGKSEQLISIRSDNDGFFKTSFTPKEAGKYTLKIVSQCRDEHRSICQNKESRLEIEVRESTSSRDERLEITLLKLLRSGEVNLLVKNISREEVVIDTLNFYSIDNDQIYPSSISKILTLSAGESKVIDLKFNSINYEEPIIMYDDGITTIRVPEFSLPFIVMSIALSISILRLIVNKFGI